MSEETEYDRVLFGQETDDEDEDNKDDHEVEDEEDEGDEDNRDDHEVEDKEEEISEEPKNKKAKTKAAAPNKRVLKLIEQTKKSGKLIRSADKIGKASFDARKADKRVKKGVPVRPKLFLPKETPFGSDPILVHEDDIKKRVEKGKEYKIKREIGIKQTRFFPFFMDAGRNVDEFYRNNTDLSCIWCTEPFDDIPIPMAYSYSRSRDAFRVGGQYCSIQCMLAKASEERLKPVCCHMLKSVYNVPFKTILETGVAPSPLLLKKFGGPMTIEEFRCTSELPNVSHRKITLPFIPLSAGLEEVQTMKSTIYEYGDEERVKRIVSASIVQVNPIPVSNMSSKVQKTKFAQMPTLQEQISQSERRLRLQRKPETSKKKKRTLRDFMNISKQQN